MLIGISVIILLSVIVLIRNEITYRIRIRWIDDIYSEKVSLRYHDMPSYYSMILDIKLWRYIPLDQYLQKKQ